jgi:hypothetical protein
VRDARVAVDARATIEEARKARHDLAAVIFDAERQSARELLAGKDAVREAFVIPLPRRAPRNGPTDPPS